MKHTLTHRLTTTAVLGMMLLSMAVPQAFAYMYPAASPDHLDIRTYPLDCSSRSIRCYHDSGLTSPTGGKVYGTDLITILKAEGDAVYVRYPSSRGPREAWIDADALCTADLNRSKSLAMTATSSVPVYRYADGDETIGSSDIEDTVYLVGGETDHHGRGQFLYPEGGGRYKLGHVTYDDFACGDPLYESWWSAESGGRTVHDGVYVLETAPGYVYDAAGANDNVHVWSYIPDAPQQKFQVTWSDSEQCYTLNALHNGKYLDVAGGGCLPGTNLQVYDWNNTASQHFFISDLGDGSYALASKRNGLFCDVEQFNTDTCGANILMWAYGGQSVKLRRVDGGPVAYHEGIVSAPQAVSAAQRRMVEQAEHYIGRTGLNGWCQRFVRMAGEEAGLPRNGYRPGRAKEAGDRWIVSTSQQDIPMGAAVYFDSYYQKHGHVEIYDGHGNVIKASKTVRKTPLSELCSRYRYRGWGWQGGVDLRTR